MGDGYVIFADWTHEGGHVIVVQHANGYVSVYKHNQRLLKRVGDRVRDREAIALSGNTGEITTGPHLHFEVLINKRFVDPLSIQVPRERKLDGRQLIEFQKERARIDDLMRRTPVKTASK